MLTLALIEEVGDLDTHEIVKLAIEEEQRFLEEERERLLKEE